MTAPRPLCIDALRLHLQQLVGREVQLVQTHVSWVLLDGQHAWKIKKPVRLGFLDFSRLDARHRACLDELRLNRRLAAPLYLDVVPVRGRASSPRLDGGARVIDYAVRMKQFPADAAWSRRLLDGTLAAASVDDLAARLGAFHAHAPRADAQTPYGAPQGIRATTEQVASDLAGRVADPRVGMLQSWCGAEHARLRDAFAERKAQGWVREGHGDLHLDNVIVFEGRATAFDCMEFDPALRWIDVQADIAFLVMDLQAQGRADLAWRFLDGWLQVTGDYAGLAVLRYYAVYRALVRALVAAVRRAEGLPAPGPDYVGVAARLTRMGAPALLITHGPSGVGKSALAGRLLEAAGAVRLRSDVERKRLLGLPALASTAGASGTAEAAYGAQTTRRTYARLREAAGAALRAGYAVIVDAAFLRAAERRDFGALARELGVPFAVLDCHADAELLRARVAARRQRGDDPSEADLGVLERQLRTLEPLQCDERAARIDVDTSGDVDVDALAARWRGRP